jgi:drug/metabolite transporter (DMT)-like permease
VRSPARGYALAAAAAAMWGLNGSMGRSLLDDGVSAVRLSQLRSFGSWLILLIVLAAWRPGLLRVERREIPSLAFLGVAGLAAVHATYFLAIERLDIGVAVTIQYLAPLLLLLWSFGFASLFWAIATPWWSFPFDELSSGSHALLAVGVVLVGTLLPFTCMVAALRHIPAPRAAVVATLEPVLAAVFAYFLHDQALAAIQIAGGVAVIAAVGWVQARRPDVEAEMAPPLREAR